MSLGYHRRSLRPRLRQEERPAFAGLATKSFQSVGISAAIWAIEKGAGRMLNELSSSE